jgi:hypothetical protein
MEHLNQSDNIKTNFNTEHPVVFVYIARYLGFTINTTIYYVSAKDNTATSFDHQVVIFRPLKYITLKL